jgi:thymidylate kinase
MLVEFAGPSGAGKTTLARRVAKLLEADGTAILTSWSFIPQHTGTTWVTNDSWRNVLLNFALLPMVIQSAPRLRVANRIAVEATLSGSTPWTAVSRFRSYARSLGQDVLLRKHDCPSTVVLVDEGMVNALHVLACYRDGAGKAFDVEQYLNAAPQPNLLVLVDAPLETLVRRTLSRPDPPLRGNPGRHQLTSFLTEARTAFRRSQEYFGERCVTVNNENEEGRSTDAEARRVQRAIQQMLTVKPRP